MKLYSCRVRLHGSVMNEVFKEAVTATEIHVLRALHGPDAVLDITPRADIERTSAEERDRLAFQYPQYADGMNSQQIDIVSKLFGPMTELPKELAGFEINREVVEEAQKPVVKPVELRKAEAKRLESLITA